MERARVLGIEPETGRTAYVLAEPGGMLDHLADVAALEACSAFLAVAEAVAEGEPTADEQAAFLGPALAMLREIYTVAVKRVGE